jgi:hypothetical protein
MLIIQGRFWRLVVQQCSNSERQQSSWLKSNSSVLMDSNGDSFISCIMAVDASLLRANEILIHNLLIHIPSSTLRVALLHFS